MGDPNGKFSHKLTLRAKSPVQIRHNALEAGRKSSNRVLDKNIGKTAYRMRIRVYPHHILRENPMATGAGADRMSEGMKRAFGKPIGLAAQVRKGQAILEVEVNEEHLEFGKTALTRFKHKLPCACGIEIVKNPEEEEKPAKPKKAKAKEEKKETPKAEEPKAEEKTEAKEESKAEEAPAAEEISNEEPSEEKKE